MKILVTGAAGFLGSHVADALTDHGHEVVLFDTKPSPWRRPEQQEIIGDILDLESFGRAIEGCDALYHFAAIADINAASGNPPRTVQVNILGTCNALELSRQHKLKRFVFASSIYVYSKQGAFYRTSKQASEQLIHDYEERYGLPYTILRFGSLYGPRAEGGNAVHDMVNQALTEKRIDYSGTGQEVREYIHVFDAAAAAAEVLVPDYENDILHLMGRERMKTAELVEMIREMMGGDIETNFNCGSKTGHYFQTPYSYTPKLGRKLVRNTYIDIGLGLLDCIQEAARHLDPDAVILDDGK